MPIIRMYCGLMLLKCSSVYACVNSYTYEVCISGTLKECADYFNEYVDRVSEAD